jgi:hypothetical protein
LLTELKQRIRDVRQGPDGMLYVLNGGGRRCLDENRTRRMNRARQAGPCVPICLPAPAARVLAIV